MLQRTALSLLILLLAATPSRAQEPAQAVPESGTASGADLLTTLESLGEFTVLVQALRDTGLDAALTTGETFTVFAPTDAAFQALPAGTLGGLTPEQLTSLLRRHVLAGGVSSEDAAALGTAATVEGSALEIAADGDGLRVTSALVARADVEASNGVIHVIEAVLLPDAAPAPVEEDVKDEGSRIDDSDLEDL